MASASRRGGSRFLLVALFFGSGFVFTFAVLALTQSTGAALPTLMSGSLMCWAGYRIWRMDHPTGSAIGALLKVAEPTTAERLDVALDALLAQADEGRNPEPGASPATDAHDAGPVEYDVAWPDGWQMVGSLGPIIEYASPDDREHIRITARPGGRYATLEAFVATSVPEPDGSNLNLRDLEAFHIVSEDSVLLWLGIDARRSVYRATQAGTDWEWEAIRTIVEGMALEFVLRVKDRITDDQQSAFEATIDSLRIERQDRAG